MMNSMNFRVYLVMVMLLVLTILLASCGLAEDNRLVYQGEERTVGEIEEIIADQLEVENPEYDLEVSIYQETEEDD